MTSQTVRVLTSFALLTLACQPAGAQPPVSISVAGGAALGGTMVGSVTYAGNVAMGRQ
jgi:hypothetical protein